LGLIENGSVNANIVMSASVGYVNLSPDAFHRWATHYYKCRQDFQSPHKFSPVPYFLLCRAIELELKARHLNTKRQLEVKNAFGHHLTKAYVSLAQIEQILSSEEFAVLKSASRIYASKGFEYFDPEDTLTAYKRFPDLAVLDSVTRKLLVI
jgi:hypothetical protein